MGRTGTARDGYVTFVLRAESPLGIDAIVNAAQAIRHRYLCAPLLDVRQRTVTCPAPEESGTLRPSAEAAAAAIEERIGSRPWIALVSAPKPDDTETILRGERWIDIARRLVGPRILERSDALFMSRLIDDREWARELAAVLDPILDYDRQQKTNVIGTLECALLDVQGNRQAADALGIERHTVARHLNTAEGVLGRDIRWGVDRMIVEQALLARRALRLRRGRGGRAVNLELLAEDV